MTSGEDLLRTVFKPGMTDNLADNIVPEVELATRWFLADRIATLREAFNRTPAWLGFNIEIKYPTVVEVAAMRTQFYCRNTVVDEVLKARTPAGGRSRFMFVTGLPRLAGLLPAHGLPACCAQVVLQEGRNRKVIFSTFDPDCATLLSLKQPRFPVFFLTCGGTKEFADPRMNSLEAALQFALSSHLQVQPPSLLLHDAVFVILKVSAASDPRLVVLPCRVWLLSHAVSWAVSAMSC
jgi:glycerophosphodiester phosphodiesterase